jgi:Xaa-Pro aminopeptidase
VEIGGLSRVAGVTNRVDLPPIDHGARRRAVTAKLCDGAHGCDAWLFTDLTDVRWLTGFTGSNGWAVVRGDDLLVGTDLRYRERARAETASSSATIVARQRATDLHDELLAALAGTEQVGLDPSTATHDVWQGIAKTVPVTPHASYVKRRRMIKDEAELARIEEAAAATDAALAEVEPLLLATVDEPVSEADVRDELEYRMRRHGADDRSYATIVASGPQHAARPHHEVSRRTIVAGDTVVVDVGALVDGYHSDMTRSWVIGPTSAQQSEVYALVADAQRAGLAAVRPGVTARSIDTACRDVFDAAGYLDWYLHGTGHGVGLDIHEPPFHSQVSGDSISPGMVVTVEPGLYRDGFGGIRIEDLVVVTETGNRVLTRSRQRPPS